VLPAEEAVDAFAAAKDSETSGKVVVALWPDGDVAGSDG
jgi:hypothetical protein